MLINTSMVFLFFKKLIILNVKDKHANNNIINKYLFSYHISHILITLLETTLNKKFIFLINLLKIYLKK